MSRRRRPTLEGDDEEWVEDDGFDDDDADDDDQDDDDGLDDGDRDDDRDRPRRRRWLTVWGWVGIAAALLVVCLPGLVIEAGRHQVSDQMHVEWWAVDARGVASDGGWRLLYQVEMAEGVTVPVHVRLGDWSVGIEKGGD